MEHAIIRIRDPAGTVVGTGFLVTKDLVCTCAHVVARATGVDPRDPTAPAGSVALDFPLVGAETGAATVIRWTPISDDDTGDIAVLRLAGPAPAGARPARLSTGNSQWDEAVRVFGFPTGRDAGVWVAGRLRGPQATGWVQFEAFDGPRVAGGYSGSPVWSTEADGVIGMVVAAEHGSGTAYLVPVPAMLDDELLAEALPDCPYRGLEPFGEQDAGVFFGRRREADRLAEYLAHRRLVVVSGRSGCGKSSLVRAALLPRLRAAGSTIVEVSARPLPAGELLGDALASVLGPAWADRVRAEPAVVGRAIAAGQVRLVLFLDQFEEVAAAEPAAARELVDWLAALVSQAPPRSGRPPAVQVVLTLRSAAVDEVFTAAHAQLLDDGSVHVLPMDRADLRAAIVEPVRSAGLVSFEPGLVDRIVEDALEAPGQLPLVQFALTRLWEHQRGGVLTHAAYAAIGRVAGAIAAYAEAVYAHHLPTAADRALARHLLVRLARPVEDGSFVLAPARLDELGPALADMARRLSALRLVMIREEPGQPPMVALAHEALIEQWRTLHDWLASDRDFLAWHARLRAQLAAWQVAGRDVGALLRGAPLAEALAWAADRPAALTEEEHGYIAAGRAAARRGIRRWRAATAVIAALALVAGGLAVAAVRQSRTLTDRLRELAAVALARESMARLNTDPGVSLQLAQAAAAHDPDSPDAEAAILIQHARYADRRWWNASLWQQPLDTATVNNDGSVISVAEADGAVTVWTGLLGSDPLAWRVTTAPGLRGLRLSADGGRLAVFGERSGVEAWDVRRRAGPVLLRPPEPGTDAAPTAVVQSAFGPDGRTLAVVLEPDRERSPGSTGPDFVEVYDIDAGQRLSAPITPHGIVDIDVLRVEADGRAVWLREYERDGTRRNVVRDVTTGALLRRLPDGWVARDGTILDCPTDRDVLTGIDGGTGATRFQVGLPDCPIGGPLDDTGRFMLLSAGLSEDAFQLVTLIDVGNGRAYQVTAPPRPPPGSPGAALAFVNPTPDGPELVVVGDAGIARTRAATPVDDPGLADLTDGDGATINADGTRAAVYYPQQKGRHAGLEVYALPSLRRMAGGPGTALARLSLSSSPTLTFTPDGRFLLTRSAAEELLVLTTTDFTVRQRIRLSVPAAADPDTPPPNGWKASFIPRPGDEVVVLYAGAFTRWRLTTGEPVGGPVPVRTDPTALRQVGQFAEAEALPGRLSQALVIVPNGLERWDLDAGVKAAEFRPEPNREVQAAAAAPDSPLVALHTRTDRLYLWDLERGAAGDQPQPVPADWQMLDMGPDDLLVFNNRKPAVELWDVELGRSVAVLNYPSSVPTWRVVGNRLLGLSEDGLLSIELDRRRALDELCALHDRPYTPEEKGLLPDGADSAPPCRVRAG